MLPAHSFDHTLNSRFIKRFLYTVLVALGLVVGTANGVVIVNVPRVGFPSLTQGDVIRNAEWVPIMVDVALDNQDSFDGYLRVGQRDVDGDECYERVAVHLRRAGRDHLRQYLYAVANTRRSQERFVVELFTEEGEAVQILSQGELGYQARSSRQVSTISDDDVLILSVSGRVIGREQDLTNSDLNNEPFIRPVHVAHLNTTDLPNLWLGLEMVDYIIWDEARPEQLTARQVQALVEWVRQGGTILITASHSAGSFEQTDSIGDVLPVEIGDLVSVDNLPELRKSLLNPPPKRRSRRPSEEDQWWNDPFPAPVAIVQCKLRQGAVSIADDGDENTVIARAPVGRGRVIFSAVTLKDLFSAKGDAVEFFRRIFDLGVQPAEQARTSTVSLFSNVVSAVGFATSGVAYLLAAGVFSLGYLVIATFGSWYLLGIRAWRKHSWSVFALVGLAASFLSIMAVNAIHGFGLGQTVHQISIVDCEEGANSAYATSFFGVKTGRDKTLDLWLPGDYRAAVTPEQTDCFLRPLPESNDLIVSSTSFADPVPYRLLPASAVLENVRIRATLKRFEGRWQGQLDGTINANILVRRSKIIEGSYIVNHLGTDLYNCYLLHSPLGPSRNGEPRSRSIHAYPIGDLPADSSRIELSSRCYPPADKKNPGKAQPQPTLTSAHQAWGAGFQGVLANLGYDSSSEAGVALGQEKNALLLLSTIGDYDPTAVTIMGVHMLGTVTFSRDRLRHLDLRSALERGRMVLIGFAKGGGPVRLFGRSGNYAFGLLNPSPDKSWTMYRVRIPVTLVESEKPAEETKTPAQ